MTDEEETSNSAEPSKDPPERYHCPPPLPYALFIVVGAVLMLVGLYILSWLSGVLQ